jgi:hypothetical protein
MLPPVLEIYVVWHGGDSRDVAGQQVAQQIVEHFHGTLFSGLIGGAVAVYARSVGWTQTGDAPRPIPLPSSVGLPGVPQAELTAIVPVLGLGLAARVEQENDPWHAYLSGLVEAQKQHADRVGIFPVQLDQRAMAGTRLAALLGSFQRIAAPGPTAEAEPEADLRCRDLAQGIAQLADPSQPQTRIFISHTKRGSGEDTAVAKLADRVRSVVKATRLQDFFDTNDLQPGEDWDQRLRSAAATSAMLAVRTDLYPSREWCQREMLIAKRAGVPLVILDALGKGEERGSFLMDHVPRVPVREANGGWNTAQVLIGLNILVDECLKRALWCRQEKLAAGRDIGISWWAPHAPEPVTMVHWLKAQRDAGRVQPGSDLRVLHPDPPLGRDERAVLEDLVHLSGITGKLDLLTPRTLAARGG